jgi:hypothetical protein
VSAPNTSLLEGLKGRDVSAVTFVQDYLQLQFDGSFLNVFVWPRLTLKGVVFEFGSSGYRDALCQLIGKTVVGVIEESNVKLGFFFYEEEVLEISLAPRDRRGPEAAMLQTGDGNFNVW